jgi:hypothetical protein
MWLMHSLPGSTVVDSASTCIEQCVGNLRRDVANAVRKRTPDHQVRHDIEMTPDQHHLYLIWAREERPTHFLRLEVLPPGETGEKGVRNLYKDGTRNRSLTELERHI